MLTLTKTNIFPINFNVYHGGGQGEGDGEPDQSSGDEAPDTLERLSSHR